LFDENERDAIEVSCSFQHFDELVIISTSIFDRARLLPWMSSVMGSMERLTVLRYSLRALSVDPRRAPADRL